MKITEDKLQNIISESIVEVIKEMKQENKKTPKKVNENKNKPVKITEQELHNMIAENTLRILKESDLDEFNIFSKEDRKKAGDRIKGAFKGAKQGYNYQKSMDRGTEGFKDEHDYDDTRRSMTNPLSKMPNTASEQAEQLLAQAKEYMAMANRLKAQANKITKQYGLQKTAVNKRQSTAQPVQAPVPAFTQGQGNRVKSNIPTRNVPKNVGQPLTV